MEQRQLILMVPPTVKFPVHATLPKAPVPVTVSPPVSTKPPVVREFVEMLLKVPVPVTSNRVQQVALVHAKV